jgi:tetratricopeptide (TPR) repeat protein
MAGLVSPLKEAVELLINQSNEEYDKGNYNRSLNLLIEAWARLPEPKGVYDESFHIVLYLSETYLFINQPVKAREWSDKIFDCDLERVDSGQRDFLAGKVAYELGDLEKAKQSFTIANQKSKGRCFSGQDMKYIKFFKR